MSIPIFDQPQVVRFNDARRDLLSTWLPDLVAKKSLVTALDAGCAFGYFSGYLKELGLEVTALDARQENVDEARKRNPGVSFCVSDIEDPSETLALPFDMVLCLGLLYHLENPFRAIRSLARLTGDVLVISTRVAPTSRASALLYEELRDIDQAVNYMALIPSKAALVKMLYRSGFGYVYQPVHMPDHEEYRSSALMRAKRTMLVAAKTELDTPILRPVREPVETNRHAWWRFGIGRVLEGLLRLKTGRAEAGES